MPDGLAAPTPALFLLPWTTVRGPPLPAALVAPSLSASAAGAGGAGNRGTPRGAIIGMRCPQRIGEPGGIPTSTARRLDEPSRQRAERQRTEQRQTIMGLIVTTHRY